MAVITLPNGSINVTVDSELIPADELKIETIDAIRTSCKLACLAKAVELWGTGQALTVRDLNGADMAYPNNIMTEQSVVANAWAAMAFGAFTVPVATVIGIYGVGFLVLHDATIDFLPITGIRIDVGGARIAQWHVQSLADEVSGSSTAPSVVYAGFTKSPVIVGEDITVTIFEYTRTTGTAYDPIWFGFAVEKEGRTLKP